MASHNDSLSWKFYLLNILVLGALLGLVEAALGGLIRQAGLPLRGPLVTAAGFAIMAAGLAIFKQARLIPGVTLVGILGKWLAVPLLGLPVFCQANAHLAILLNGACLYAGVSLFRKKIADNPRGQSVVAGIAAFAGGSAFFALGGFWAPCRHLLSFHHAGGAVPYMLTRVAPAALLAALLFPLGYALGRRLEKWLLPLWLARRPLLIPLAATIALACWGGTVLLTAAGF
ncbi:MAG: hypothetical protein MUC72_07575 [Acidobacteria bacterium]|jgi:hypothetical protein|nr:hypothetical protein [Acidobacteriota bacterium]